MKKQIGTVFKILIIMIILQFICIPKSQASFWGDIFEAGDNFINEGKNENRPIQEAKVQIETRKIYNLLFTLGVVLTVIIGAVLGIKYMFGGIEDQAKIKETLIPYIVGCIVIFGAFGIWRLVVNIMSEVT